MSFSSSTSPSVFEFGLLIMSSKGLAIASAVFDVKLCASSATFTLMPF